MKSLPLAALCASLATAAFAETSVTEIALLAGERWWGGGGGDGQSQPCGAADSRRIDLRRHERIGG